MRGKVSAKKRAMRSSGITPAHDLRDLINATVQLRDGKKITDMELPFIEKIALKEVLKKIQGTDIEKFLKEYNAI